MSQKSLSCEEQVKKLKKINRRLVLGGILTSVIVGVVAYQIAGVSMIGGGARISEDDAITMIRHYRMVHPWGTNSFLVNRQSLNELTDPAVGGDPTSTHLHFFYGSTRLFGPTTLIITGAKNIQTDVDPSFINTAITDQSLQPPRRFDIEHVFPVEAGICTELDENGTETGRQFPVEGYPDNRPH